MIRITRTNCPRLLNRLSTEENLYKAEPVVHALYEMQNGKCCYCEGEIPETGPRKTIEHFRPKERDEFKSLKNDWGNLLLACFECNGNKSNKFPVDEHSQPLIIDPTDPSINPEEHLEFIVSLESICLYGMIFERNNSSFGRATINAINLDSKALIQARGDFIQQLYLHFHQMLKAMRDNELDNATLEKTLILKYAEPRKKFSACAKEFIEKMKVNERFDNWLATRTDG
jgi:uncharacterized protein (TIGR02646 family)